MFWETEAWRKGVLIKGLLRRTGCREGENTLDVHHRTPLTFEKKTY